MADAVLDYYARPGPTTRLDAYADPLSELPSDPAELAGVVRGLILHQGLVAGRELPSERFADRERVGAASVLQGVLSLDASPLLSQRPPERRMVGYCYHFAVLHCAFLRAKGVPARARCGFAAYYRNGAWIDHWIVEYWNGDAWIRIDPDSARDVVAAHEFHDAGTAWRLCRAGHEDPFRHGNYEQWGWGELRGSLVADLGALNKVEVGDWETWCDWLEVEAREQPNARLDSKLDALAERVGGDLEGLRKIFGDDPHLRPPLPV